MKPRLFAELPDQAHLENHVEYIDGAAVLAAYTLHQMPAELRALSNLKGEDANKAYVDLAAKHAEILDDAAPDVYSNSDKAKAEIAQLDLLFMLGCYLPGEAEADALVPPQLRAMLTYNAERFRLPKHMDYDMIIDVNTRRFMETGEIRVYSDGPERNSERDFYIGHYYAEPKVKDAVGSVRTILENPDLPNKKAMLDFARTQLTACRAIIGNYAQMPPEHFIYFRRHLMAYADGTRNASGTFLPSIQQLEVAMHAPTTAYLAFLEEAQPYFPAWARERMAEQTSDSRGGNNLLSKVLQGGIHLSTEELKSFRDLADEFLLTKNTHAQVAHRLIPKAFSAGKLVVDQVSAKPEQDIFAVGEAVYAGTGDFNIPHLLGNGLKRLHDLKRILEDLIIIQDTQAA
ncbi:MAG TPA: hypothetical protein VFB59_04795 [Candidatus Saccharimonadales bacterium]|nr:hypothetical protein [Candidatus Saccharimonadales bacterium]